MCQPQIYFAVVGIFSFGHILPLKHNVTFAQQSLAYSKIRSYSLFYFTPSILTHFNSMAQICYVFIDVLLRWVSLSVRWPLLVCEHFTQNVGWGIPSSIKQEMVTLSFFLNVPRQRTSW